MPAIRIRVFGADGLYRGGLFRDHLDRKYRWMGTPKPDLQEVMVCCEEPVEGSWYLLQIVMPREVDGEEANDSLIDERSRCCARTPAQALHWFQQQDFGPPPQLISRVRAISACWKQFKNSSKARALFETLRTAHCTRSDAAILEGLERELDLLRRLELVVSSFSGSDEGLHVRSHAEDMVTEAFIEWTDRQLAQVAPLLDSATTPNPHGRSTVRSGRKTSSSVRGRTVVSSAERDATALKTAKEWDESGREWTLTDLANALACDRSQLTGSTSKGGPKRCPMFSVYWEAKQRELQQRQLNLRSTNRTAGSSDE